MNANVNPMAISKPAALAVHRAARRTRARAMFAWLLKLRRAVSGHGACAGGAESLDLLSERELADIGLSHDRLVRFSTVREAAS